LSQSDPIDRNRSEPFWPNRGWTRFDPWLWVHHYSAEFSDVIRRKLWRKIIRLKILISPKLRSQSCPQTPDGETLGVLNKFIINVTLCSACGRQQSIVR